MTRQLDWQLCRKRVVLWRRSLQSTACLLSVFLLVDPLAAACVAGQVFDLEKARAHFGSLKPLEELALSDAQLVTSKDDRGDFFTVLSWGDKTAWMKDIDTRVFGLRPLGRSGLPLSDLSLHYFAHRRRVWGQIALSLAQAPTVWSSFGDRHSMVAAYARARAGAAEGSESLDALAKLVERSAAVLEQMKLNRVAAADRGGDLANDVKNLMRKDGSNLQAGLKRGKSLFAALKVLEIVDLSSNLVVAAVMSRALANDEAIERGEALLEIARKQRDPAFQIGVEDALNDLVILRDGSYWDAFVKATEENLPALVSWVVEGSTVGLARILEGTSWWKTISPKLAVKGLSYMVLGVVAWEFVVQSLTGQNLALQRVALLAVAESAIRSEFESARSRSIETDEDVIGLADLEVLHEEAAIWYFEHLISGVRPDGWIFLQGADALISWLPTVLTVLSPAQQVELARRLLVEGDLGEVEVPDLHLTAHGELRDQLQKEQTLYRNRLLAAVRALGDLLCPSPAPPAAGSDSVDLIFCIDTTGSMADDIDAAKAAVTAMIRSIFASVPDPRIALVAYRDYGDAYVTKGWPFTTDPSEIERNVLALEVGGGGDDPEAVYEALLHAINTEGLGPWRNGVKKIVVAIGDAPPHTRRHTLDEVAKRAEEVDPAHVYAIGVKGSTPATLRAFEEIARRTGGLVVKTADAAELPAKMVEIARIGASYGDRDAGLATIVRIDGAVVELRATTGVFRSGLEVEFFDPGDPKRIIARGLVTSVVGDFATVELQTMEGPDLLTGREAVGFVK